MGEPQVLARAVGRAATILCQVWYGAMAEGVGAHSCSMNVHAACNRWKEGVHQRTVPDKHSGGTLLYYPPLTWSQVGKELVHDLWGLP